jgi:hypothetical protein
MVITVADPARVCVNGGCKLVEPSSDGGTGRRPEIVAHDPQFEACEFPPEPVAVERPIPWRQLARLDPGKAFERTEEAPGDAAPLAGWCVVKEYLSVIGTKILQHHPFVAEVVIEQGGHSQTTFRTPGTHLEITHHL